MDGLKQSIADWRARSERRFLRSCPLIIELDGEFDSRNPITLGTHRLFGKIADVSLAQQIEVPIPPENAFANLGNGLGAVEAPVNDLADVVVVRKKTMKATQQ